jgi:CRISPR-associated endonuclease/helicase Cas3
MSEAKAEDFDQFFFELHNREPFPWQTRLAAQACRQRWPKVIDLPTASGKTACIDIALFALAVLGNEAPRRIFFVVDRRVIVSEAYERAQHIGKKLEHAPSGLLKRIADELRRLSGRDTPLCTYELRGGAFRDETWVQSPRQPAVIASTVDQVGSRLLFRGYGVSESTWSMHAGLIANDSIIFLDEAHCSKAFSQTLEAVENYRGDTWASKPLKRPFHFVEMTATPNRVLSPDERFTIDTKDRENEILRSRLLATKPTRLAEPIKCRKDEFGKFAQALLDQAIALAKDVDAKRVAIMANRIATAKAVYNHLRTRQIESTLVIGRMRPLDREDVNDALKPFKSGNKRDPQDTKHFVVSTQCLEVGADLDFDVIVSECASIDALQQRFGRLDRIGRFGKARGAVVAASWQLTGNELDPVYGESLRETWNFLRDHSQDNSINFGIEAEASKTAAQKLAELDSAERRKLVLTSEDAPTLLPAHVDALVQTSPQPEPEPFIDYFLHGSGRGSPDVYVVWRADLGDATDRWSEIVALCPPSSAEAMPVPIWTFRKWLQGLFLSDESDTEFTAASADEENAPPKQDVLLWNGFDSTLVKSVTQIRPGATLVLPSSSESWDVFGFRPPTCPIDRGDEARFQLRRRITLRLHTNLLTRWPEPAPKLDSLLSKEGTDADEIWEALRDSKLPQWVKLETFFDKGDLNCYPFGPGWVLEAYYPKDRARSRKKILLSDHLKHVESATESIVGDLVAPALKQAIKTSARYHDYGKADPRFQTWLRNGDAMAARYAPKPIAKSGKTILRKQTDCELPPNFRHELISFLFAARSKDVDPETRDLTLHLISSHHGYCRPFAPMSVDPDAGCVKFDEETVCAHELIENPPFSLKWSIADRFWQLTREYGWWGLAYLEAMLRLADWMASEEEGTEVYG